MTYKSSKLGQIDIVFGWWSAFISLCTHTDTQTDSFWPVILL